MFVVKKLLVIGALTSMMFLNAGCEPEEIAAGAVGVAIGVGLANSNNHSYPPVYSPRPNPRPPVYAPAPPPPPHHGPGYGRPGYGHDRPGYGRPGYGHDRPGYGNNRPGYPGYGRPNNWSAAPASTNDNVKNFANRHGISLTQASKISKAFDGAKNGSLSNFANIGLAENDLKKIVRRKLPDQASLSKVATKLDMSDAQARDLVKFMIADFDEVASDVNSDYWKSCMAKGKWKTQLTTFCTSTITQGCAPKSGALYCYQ